MGVEKSSNLDTRSHLEDLEPKDWFKWLKDRLDTDGDGLINLRERLLGTDPHNPDTDGDGFEDGYEKKRLETSPLERNVAYSIYNGVTSAARDEASRIINEVNAELHPKKFRFPDMDKQTPYNTTLEELLLDTAFKRTNVRDYEKKKLREEYSRYGNLLHLLFVGGSYYDALNDEEKELIKNFPAINMGDLMSFLLKF